MTGHRLLVWYYWCSCAVIAANTAILVSLRSNDILSAEVIGIAGNLGALFVMMLPAAFFGLIAGLLVVIRANARGQRRFFGTAAIVNFILAYSGFGVISQKFDHCFDPCAAPSQTAIFYAAAACALVTVVAPTVIYFLGRKVFGPDEDE
jgi:hypothetical protein